MAAVESVITDKRAKGMKERRGDHRPNKTNSEQPQINKNMK